MIFGKTTLRDAAPKKKKKARVKKPRKQTSTPSISYG